MNKIVFTGPESTGKSTLAKICADKYNLPLVEEYARQYLEELNRPYVAEDLNLIAKRQWELIKEASIDQELIICDTDLLTMMIWYEEKSYKIPHWIKDEWEQDSECINFLCYPDLPWEHDPQRENPHDRLRLYHIYKKYLEDHKKTYHCISESYDYREDLVHQVLSLKGILPSKYIP